jgi:hypothetical protein
MSSKVVRWGGMAGAVAAAMWLLSFILIQLTSLPKVFESFSDYLIEVVLLVGYAGTMGAILGLHALQSQSGRYGRQGAVGSLLTFIGYAIVFVATTGSMLQGSQALLSVRITGGIAVLVGSVLLGAITLYARVVPWWCGVLLIVAFPLGDFSNAIVKGGEGILLGLLWGSVAYALLRSAPQSTAEQHYGGCSANLRTYRASQVGGAEEKPATPSNVERDSVPS